MQRICFQLQLDPQRLDEYRQRHAAVWPEMLRELQASGRTNYSLFLSEDGLLIGYYEVESAAKSDAYLAASASASRWEAAMAEFFLDLGGRPDQSSQQLEEVFNLHDQVEALASGGQR